MQPKGGTTLGNKLYRRVVIKDAEGLRGYHEYLPNGGSGRWLYRGMSRNYQLQTSLERALIQSDGNLKEAATREKQLLIEFKRRAHHYLQHLPGDEDVLEWLTLMQHYGAPTRLLDWTYSFPVAAFFALEKADSIQGEGKATPEPCVVWALNRDHFSLTKQYKAAADAYREAASSISTYYDYETAARDKIQVGINAVIKQMAESPSRCVWTVNSFRLNERLTVQQGVFLAPGDVTASFEDNLRAGSPSPLSLIRFDIATKPDKRAEMLRELHQMNISRASLFPGLSGFAESLTLRLFTPEILRPADPIHI